MIVYRELTPADVSRVLPLYIAYYNGSESCEWTEETAQKRILQVVTMQDAFGLIAEEDGGMRGFAMGYFQQYDDGVAYELAEIVVAGAHQSRGIGSALLREVERRAKASGAFLIQLASVNDARHERFYGRLGYRTASNLVLKSKVL